MKNVKNDPSPAAREALGGKGRGLGPAAPRGAHPPPHAPPPPAVLLQARPPRPPGLCWPVNTAPLLSLPLGERGRGSK